MSEIRAAAASGDGDRPNPPPRPTLITFDVFGTILDWRRGLAAACRAAGRPLDAAAFDRVVDAQGSLERGDYLDYTTITARSLVDVLGMDADDAARIGREAGRWPPYPDSAGALRTLMRVAPCVATTNSDRRHGRDVAAGLGFDLDGWVCAEDLGFYKPDPRFWHAVAARREIAFGAGWWHVSAYADYDLTAADALGLTTVFVRRAHARPGPSTVAVDGLLALAALLAAAVQGVFGAPP